MRNLFISFALLPVACFAAVADFDNGFNIDEIKLPSLAKYWVSTKQGQKLTPQQRNQIYQRCIEETQAGYKWLNIADEHSWYIPQPNIRDCITKAIENAIIGMTAKDTRSKVIAVIVSLGVDIGATAFDEYYKCQEALLLSKHHFEIAEFCQEILMRG